MHRRPIGSHAPRPVPIVLTATAAGALAFFALGGSAAAHGGATAPAAQPTEPVVTPLAAALVPGPIHLNRTARSNVVTARLDFAPGASAGWHTHAGAVLVQVTSGAITLRHPSHGRCLTNVVRAGHGFFEQPGAVHIAVNRGRHAATVVATFVLPPGTQPEDRAPVPAACR